MSQLRTLKRHLDGDAVKRGLKNQRPRIKTGTVHEHFYGPIQRNWQGCEFDQCLRCGAIFFIKEAAA
jgi:hypothetical protein